MMYILYTPFEKHEGESEFAVLANFEYLEVKGLQASSWTYPQLEHKNIPIKPIKGKPPMKIGRTMTNMVYGVKEFSLKGELVGVIYTGRPEVLQLLQNPFKENPVVELAKHVKIKSQITNAKVPTSTAKRGSGKHKGKKSKGRKTT